MSRLSFNVQDDIATDRRIKLEPGLDNLIEFEALLGGGPPPLPPDQAPRQPPLPAEFAMLGLKGASLAYVLGDCETPEFLDVMITISGRPGVVFHWIADRVYEEEFLSETRAILFWIEFNYTTYYGKPFKFHLVSLKKMTFYLSNISRSWFKQPLFEGFFWPRRLACAMRSLAIVFTILQSFFFWPRRLACAMRACVRHA